MSGESWYLSLGALVYAMSLVLLCNILETALLICLIEMCDLNFLFLSKGVIGGLFYDVMRKSLGLLELRIFKRVAEGESELI